MAGGAEAGKFLQAELVSSGGEIHWLQRGIAVRSQQTVLGLLRDATAVTARGGGVN